jgi:glucose-6-phosphate isomerase
LRESLCFAVGSKALRILSMPFHHEIEQSFVDTIGSGGVERSGYLAALAEAEQASSWLMEQYASEALPMLRYPEKRDDLAGIQSVASLVAMNTTDVVFLGTGGSSLGGQTLAQLKGRFASVLAPFQTGPRLHFLDNLDPDTLYALLAALPLVNTKFVAVSKSGGTGETLAQVMVVIEALKKAGLGEKIAAQFVGLSETTKPGKINALRALLEPYGVRFLEHDDRVGGRYTVLTNVGLLPAAIAGVDLALVRAGAQSVMLPFLEGAEAKNNPVLQGVALTVSAMRQGKSAQVLLAYADVLERMTRWWAQLWGESLGKGGLGSTPVPALGPVDQHSQLQLWLDGPADKLVSVVLCDRRGKGSLIDSDLAMRAREDSLSGRTIGDFTSAQAQATVDTLARNGKPVRVFRLHALDERGMGALLMHFMLETVLAGRVLGIDPFDQPAVEEGKILAKSYLRQGF